MDFFSSAGNFRQRASTVSLLVGMLAVAASLIVVPAAFAMDAQAAQMLARQSGCFKCHSVDKKKDGPPYREVAAKYKGVSGADAKLYHHVTSGEKAKFPDGHEEEHKIIQTTDTDAIKNLIDWILSL